MSYISGLEMSRASGPLKFFSWVGRTRLDGLGKLNRSGRTDGLKRYLSRLGHWSSPAHFEAWYIYLHYKEPAVNLPVRDNYRYTTVERQSEVAHRLNIKLPPIFVWCESHGCVMNS